jgi:hypothetical protein
MLLLAGLPRFEFMSLARTVAAALPAPSSTRPSSWLTTRPRGVGREVFEALDDLRENPTGFRRGGQGGATVDPTDNLVGYLGGEKRGLQRVLVWASA